MAEIGSVFVGSCPSRKFATGKYAIEINDGKPARRRTATGARLCQAVMLQNDFF
jgi:hypothetical protein